MTLAISTVPDGVPPTALRSSARSLKSGEPAMPPKLETIRVYYQPGQNPNFRFVTQLPKGKNTKKRELLFRNDHFDGFMLHYRLDHPSFGDLKFPNDPQRALSSAVMTGPE